MTSRSAKFFIGQRVVHRLFDYRGVVVDVDAIFSRSDAWYDQVAKTRPPKDEPWYVVLVHDRTSETYVAERNLMNDAEEDPIQHPHLHRFFDRFEGGRYLLRNPVH